MPQGAVRTLGPEVGDFMAEVGAPLLPWQQHVMDVAFGVRADGKWAAYEVAIWLARQNGKGRCTEAQELFGAYILREKMIIHSAHEFDTAAQAFDRLVEIIENCDWLRKRTAKIIRGKGSEGIELTREAGGGQIRFKARTAHSTRGFSGDRIVLDEAYALTVAQFKAMSPVLATIPNPQITYTSSPPDEKTGPMPEDALTPSIRRRGMSGSEPRLAMFEWSPPSRDIDPGDVDLWYACNPSLGYLIDEEFLRDQFRIFAADGKERAFAVEHLGLWPDEPGQAWAAIDRQAWQEAEEKFDPPSALALAITVSPDRQWANICAAGAIGDGKYGVAILDRREGTGWVVQRLFERVRSLNPVAVLINRSGPEGSLWAEVSEANLAEYGKTDGTTVELVQVSPQNVAAADEALWDGICGPASIDPDTNQVVNPRVVRHLGQPELTAAAAAAVWKVSTNGSRQFDPSAGDVSALKGCALALQGFREREPAMETPWVWDGL